jgi:hypothetical protein
MRNILAAIFLTAGTTCLAGDFGAITNGNWTNASTWTPASIPGANDDVYIGSTYPIGSAAAATVILVQNQSAGNVYLGFDSGTAGTLNLGNYKLDIGDSFYIGGGSASSGTVIRGSGSFAASSLWVCDGNTFTFGTQDEAASLIVFEGAAANTTSSVNITDSVSILVGSTLTLGANMSLTGKLDIWAASTLDMAGHSLSADQISLSDTAKILNGGQISAHSIDIDKGSIVAAGIQGDTLTLKSGSTVTIQPIPGGPAGDTTTAVPEPSVLLMMGIGSVGLLVLCHKQKLGWVPLPRLRGNAKFRQHAHASVSMAPQNLDVTKH